MTLKREGGVAKYQKRSYDDGSNGGGGDFGVMATPALAEENSAETLGRCGSIIGSSNQNFPLPGDMVEIFFGWQNPLYRLMKGIPLGMGQAFSFDLDARFIKEWENSTRFTIASALEKILEYSPFNGFEILSTGEEWPSCVPSKPEPQCYNCDKPEGCTPCPIACPCNRVIGYKYEWYAPCPGTDGGWNYKEDPNDPYADCVALDCGIFSSNYECYYYRPVQTNEACVCGSVDPSDPWTAVQPYIIRSYLTHCACNDPSSKCPTCECTCQSNREECVNEVRTTVRVSKVIPCTACIEMCGIPGCP